MNNQKLETLENILFDGLNLETGIEAKLWNAANTLRSNSTLKASEYATPVLGLIFLKYASVRFEQAKPLVEADIQPWEAEDEDAIKKLYVAKCGFYLPENARFDYLLEGKYKVDNDGKKSLQKAIIEAMEAIESFNENLNGTLPKNQYTKISDDDILEGLLKAFSIIDMDAEGDLFGKIYEYFLGKFALAEGQKGGQFFTPTSIVKLIVEVIEPYRGKILDPSCGSGGMFAQSAKFIQRNQNTTTQQLSVYGIEKIEDTVNLAKMNLAVNGLNSDIRNMDIYYNDPFDIDEHIEEHGHGQFDYVMANPPFNVKTVAEDKVNGKRFSFYGLPTKASKTTSKTAKNKIKNFSNANYLWANLFGSALNPTGRAGFVMANSASDARGEELKVRKNIVDKDLVDVIVAVSSNFFISVTLPITIWFYDKGKPENRKNKTLFIDARNTYTQVTRAIRTFTQAQNFDLSAIVWLYRGETEKYNELIKLYNNALSHWKNGSTDYKSIEAATKDTQQTLHNLQAALVTWIESTTRLSHNDKTNAARIDFYNKIEAVNCSKTIEAYKALQELVSIAERELKVKGNKTFNNLDIKDLLKTATKAYEHQQFIQERIQYFENHLEWHAQRFANGNYTDVEGLCKMATLEEIQEQNYSLNAGRYVGVALEEDNLTAEEFKTDMTDLHQQLLQLNSEAVQLETLINQNLEEVL
jgi:type I restriction enzyme M protein